MWSLLFVACGTGPNLALGEAEENDTLGALAREALDAGAEAIGGPVELISLRGSVSCRDGGLVPETGVWWDARLRSTEDPRVAQDCLMEEGSLECYDREDQFTDLHPILDWTVDSPRACRRLPDAVEWLDVQAIGCLRANFCQAFGDNPVELEQDLPADRAAYYYHEVDDLSLFPVTRVVDGVTGRTLYSEGF